MNSGPRFSIYDVLAATGGTLQDGFLHEGTLFKGITTDSRQCSSGNLFVALQGETFDGHHYLDQAIQKGAAGLLIHRRTDKTSKDLPVILVRDTLQALGDLAHFWRRKFSPIILAITGSSGKTTTKEMAAAILGRGRKILKTEGNFNNLIGLPLTLFNLKHDHTTAILELGTNQRGEIARLTRIAAPEIGLITNIGPAHLEGFANLAGVAEEKKDLFLNMPPEGTIIINHDDPFLHKSGEAWTGRRISFGFKEGADVGAEKITYRHAQGTSFTLRIGEEHQEVNMSIAGEHQVMNALAAAASAWAAGVTIADIGQGLTNFSPVPGRMEVLPLKNGAFVINDTYNANPSSVGEALKTLKTLKGKGRSVVILGDMLELGDQEELWHQEIGGLLADTGVDRVYLRGRLAGATAAGALKQGLPASSVIHREDPEEITSDIISYAKDGDWILVKGSRRMKMETIVEMIVSQVGRGRR
ncbi:MAG: UDP-N-acetylmuramoyl-tripeptide--D-alanyl-D-alanine ligase [Syntrophales bacterium]|jgi:UDP-N-acetylmuramoyl-tripeptide--D-alanyl-D-alanine ligase|nr:UDP-N-acetylmuramoyl-tripeptide--D-alanyl-D-alanine ligase [Syntrophales bacterium]